MATRWLDWYVGGINDEATRLLPVSRATRKPDPGLEIAIIICMVKRQRPSIAMSKVLRGFHMVYTVAWEGPAMQFSRLRSVHN